MNISEETAIFMTFLSPFGAFGGSFYFSLSFSFSFWSSDLLSCCCYWASLFFFCFALSRSFFCFSSKVLSNSSYFCFNLVITELKFKKIISKIKAKLQNLLCPWFSSLSYLGEIGLANGRWFRFIVYKIIIYAWLVQSPTYR